MIEAEAMFRVVSVACAALAPVIPIRYIAARHLDAARDVWLVALAWLGALAVAGFVSLPLGILTAAVLLHWRSWEQLPAVATWAAIAVTVALTQQLGDVGRAWLPVGWRVVTALLLLFAIDQRWHGFEVKGTTGSRILLASLLVLVWPFTSVVEWPLYALGVWLTSSWIALAALLVALVVRYPVTAPYCAAFAALVMLLFAIPPLRRATIDRTPRGGSLDGLHMRARTYRAMLRVTTQQRRWLRGWGPAPASRLGPSLEHALQQEVVRLSADPSRPHALATTPCHCEPLEVVCTYGLLGALALAILGYQLATRLVLGDPWSAAAAAGVVLACASIPARAAPVGVVWLITLAIVLR